jgi:hypothetical protein
VEKIGPGGTSYLKNLEMTKAIYKISGKEYAFKAKKYLATPSLSVPPNIDLDWYLSLLH